MEVAITGANVWAAYASTMKGAENAGGYRPGTRGRVRGTSRWSLLSDRAKITVPHEGPRVKVYRVLWLVERADRAGREEAEWWPERYTSARVANAGRIAIL